MQHDLVSPVDRFHHRATDVVPDVWRPQRVDTGRFSVRGPARGSSGNPFLLEKRATAPTEAGLDDDEIGWFAARTQEASLIFDYWLSHDGQCPPGNRWYL
jgi:hypothetical protein